MSELDFKVRVLKREVQLVAVVNDGDGTEEGLGQEERGVEMTL